MSKSLDGVLTQSQSRETFTEEQIADPKACTDPVTGYLIPVFFFNIPSC